MTKPKPFADQIRDHLRKYQAEGKMTFRELAAKLEIDLGPLHKFMAGKRLLREDNLNRIGERLGLRVKRSKKGK